MKKYQLWSRDEYGQGSILMTSDNISEVISRGKKEITSINVQNALTDEDRERNWEAYMVFIESSKRRNKNKHYVYAGSSSRDRNKAYVIDGDVVECISLEDIPEYQIKIYLGDISTERGKEVDWYATDVKQKEINRVDHPELEGKTQLFVIGV